MGGRKRPIVVAQTKRSGFRFVPEADPCKLNVGDDRLCLHMLPDYHQLELEMRLMLVQTQHGGSIYD